MPLMKIYKLIKYLKSDTVIKMNYCDLNEYEDYIENIEFFLKERCLQICIINSELKNRKKKFI